MKKQILLLLLTGMVNLNSLFAQRENGVLEPFMWPDIMRPTERVLVQHASNLQTIMENRMAAHNIPGGHRGEYAMHFRGAMSTALRRAELFSMNNPTERQRQESLSIGGYIYDIANSNIQAARGLTRVNNEHFNFQNTGLRWLAEYDAFRYVGVYPNRMRSLYNRSNSPSRTRGALPIVVDGPRYEMKNNAAPESQTFKVYNLHGKLVLSKSRSTEMATFDNLLSKGIYIVNVTSGSEVISSYRVVIP